MTSNDLPAQAIWGICLVGAGVGSALLGIASRWVGSVVFSMAAIAALFVTYKPILNDTPLGQLHYNPVQRAMVGAIVLALGAWILQLPRVPKFARLAYGTVAPIVLLYLAFDFFHLPENVDHLVFGDFIKNVGPFALAAIVAWMLLEPLAHGPASVAGPIVLTLFSTGVATVLMFASDDMPGGMFGCVLGAVTGGAVVTALVAILIFKKPMAFGGGPVLVVVTLLAAMAGRADLTGAHKFLALVGLGPILAWVCEIGPIRRLKAWKKESLRTLLVAVPTAIAILLAFRQFKKDAPDMGQMEDAGAAPVATSPDHRYLSPPADQTAWPHTIHAFAPSGFPHRSA